MTRIRALAGALAVAAGLSGCAFVYEGNFSYPGASCRMLSGWCVLEVPTVGYLAVGAGNSGERDHTMIAFRLAPRAGATVAWSSAEITLVDLESRKSVQVRALDAKPVAGRPIAAGIAEEHWVLYGPYAPGEYRLQPRIAKLEVRLPPILRDGQAVTVAPLRIDDGPRMPKVVFSLPQ